MKPNRSHFCLKINFGPPGARQGPIATAFRDRPAGGQILMNFQVSLKRSKINKNRRRGAERGGPKDPGPNPPLNPLLSLAALERTSRLNSSASGIEIQGPRPGAQGPHPGPQGPRILIQKLVSGRRTGSGGEISHECRAHPCSNILEIYIYT